MKLETLNNLSNPDIIRKLHREENIVFCDIETSGLDPGEHEILEIGFVGLNQEKYPPLDFKFKMKHPERASNEALRINHYNKDQWKDAKPIEEHYELLASLYKNCILAGWNFGFDISFIKQYIPRKYHTWDYHFLDIMSMYKILFYHHIPSFLSSKYNDEEKRNFISSSLTLHKACELLNIDTKIFGRTHEAMTDALLTRELYINITLDMLKRDIGYFLSVNTGEIINGLSNIRSIIK